MKKAGRLRRLLIRGQKWSSRSSFARPWGAEVRRCWGWRSSGCSAPAPADVFSHPWRSTPPSAAATHPVAWRTSAAAAHRKNKSPHLRQTIISNIRFVFLSNITKMMKQSIGIKRSSESSSPLHIPRSPSWEARSPAGRFRSPQRSSFPSLVLWRPAGLADGNCPSGTSGLGLLAPRGRGAWRPTQTFKP